VKLAGRRSAWLCALLLAPAFACRNREPPAPPTAARYVVRAEIARLPARPGDELLLRHEAIPGFRDRSGAVVGMGSMVMGFGTAADLPLAGLAPGDPVEVTFTVDWERPALTVERLVRLPPGTTLTFGKRAP